MSEYVMQKLVLKFGTRQMQPISNTCLMQKNGSTFWQQISAVNAYGANGTKETGISLQQLSPD